MDGQFDQRQIAAIHKIITGIAELHGLEAIIIKPDRMPPAPDAPRPAPSPGFRSYTTDDRGVTREDKPETTTQRLVREGVEGSGGSRLGDDTSCTLCNGHGQVVVFGRPGGRGQFVIKSCPRCNGGDHAR